MFFNFKIILFLIILCTNALNINSNQGVEFVNEDILNKYADYGVEFNGFSIDKDGKINYPALMDSLKYAEQTNLNACNDFYEFVCRGVKNKVDKAKEMKKNEPPMDKLGRDKWTHNVLIVEQIENFWLDYFNNGKLSKELPANISSNLLTFFNKCNSHSFEEDEFASTLITQFGLNQFHENDSSPIPFHEFNNNWILRTYPYNPFFTLDRIPTKEIGPDGKTVEGNEFNFELLYMNFNGEFLQSYQDWLKEYKFAKKIRNPGVDSEKVQQKLLEIANILGKMNDDIDTNITNKFNVSEFQNKFGQNGKFNWINLFKNLYPNAKVEGKSVVKIYYWDTFKKFMNIMQKYGESKSEIDKAAMSEYLIWSLINSMRMFNEETFSPLLCIRKFMFTYFPHPLSKLLFTKMGIENNTNRRREMEIYKYSRLGMQKTVNESSWNDQKHRKYLIEKLEKIFTTIGMDEEIEPNTHSNEIYKKYNLNEGMNWLEMLVHVRRTFKRNYPRRDIYYTDSSVYNGFRNQISIGNVNKLLPVFHFKFPTEYNFGYFGTLLGHEQTHAIQLSSPNMDLMEGGFGAKFWDAKYTKEYEMRIKCLQKQYEKEFKKLYPNLTHADTVTEDMADNVGLVAAFNGWKLFERDLKTRNGTPAKATFASKFYKYSPEQTFFIGSAFPWCFTDRDDPERNQFPKGVDIHSVARMRVNIGLMNFPEFSSAFQCKPNEAMNPKKHCQFF